VGSSHFVPSQRICFLLASTSFPEVDMASWMSCASPMQARSTRRRSALKGLTLIAATFAATVVAPVAFVAPAGQPHASLESDGLQRRQAVGALASATFLSMLPGAASAQGKPLFPIFEQDREPEVPEPEPELTEPSKYGNGEFGSSKFRLPVISVDAFQKMIAPQVVQERDKVSIWDTYTKGFETPAQKQDRLNGRSPSAGVLPGLTQGSLDRFYREDRFKLSPNRFGDNSK